MLSLEWHLVTPGKPLEPDDPATSSSYSYSTDRYWCLSSIGMCMASLPSLALAALGLLLL